MEWKRDFHKNCLLFDGKLEDTEHYSMRMILKKAVPNILPLKIQQLDEEVSYCYDITNLQSLKEFAEENLLKKQFIKNVFESILGQLKTSKQFLLKEEDFVFLPETIFIDSSKQQLYFCYCHGYQKDIQEQLNFIMEYFLERVDYEDKEAVFMVYGLYKVSKQNCTYKKIEEILNRSEKTEKIDATIKSENQVIQERVEVREQGQKQSQKPYGKLEEMVEIEDNSATTYFNANDINKNNFYEDDRTYKNNKIYEDDKTYKNGKTNKNNQTYKTNINKRTIRTNLDKTIMEQEQQNERNKTNEEEKLTYPIWVWIGCALSVLISLASLAFATFSGQLVNQETGELYLIRLVVVFGIVGIVEIIVLNWFLQEKHKIIKEDNNRKNDTMIQPYERGFEFEKSNRERNIQVDWEEDEETVVLATRETEQFEQFYLSPLCKDLYEDIIIMDFPFFIGKLKEKVNAKIEARSISRYHARIDREGGEIYITDLESTNGTFVNGKRLKSGQKQMIAINDEISFANITYKFLKV